MINEFINKVERQGDLYQRISALESVTGIGAVTGAAFVLSVNSKTGTVVLNSQDVGAYPVSNPSGFISRIENLVYTTGNQAISGVKTFTNNLDVRPEAAEAAVLHIESGKVGINNEFPSASLDVSGSVKFTERPIVNQIPLSLSGDIRLQNYSLQSSNFDIPYNTDFIIANSSSGITGQLYQPVSGFILNLNNINSGSFTITGAKIDYELGITLGKNEGVSILGVSSINYTGWISISQTLGF